MHIKLFFLVSFFAVSFGFTQAAPQKYFLSGDIDFPKGVKEPKIFPFFYKGTTKSIEIDHHSKSPKKGYFDIYDEKDNTELYIIITEYLSIPKNSEITQHYTSPRHAYRYFKITKNASKGWTVQELKATNPVLPIADNTLIFFMNPDYIKALIPATGSSKRLPTLVFKDTITQKEFEDSAGLMMSASLDFKPFHKKETKTSVAFAQKSIISLPAPDNKYLS